jgi:hypothetical protein
MNRAADSLPRYSSVEVLAGRLLTVGLRRRGEPETNAARCTLCLAAAARAGPVRSSSAPPQVQRCGTSAQFVQSIQSQSSQQ